MNKKLLTAAIAAVSMAGFSQGSYAVGLSPSDVPDIEVYMAGSTAQDKAIKALFMNLCGPVTALNPYGGSQSQDLSIFNTTGHTAFFCTLNTKTAANFNGIQGLSKMVNGVLTPVTSAKVLFHKSSYGGGLIPLATGTATLHMRVNAVSCATSAVVAAGAPDTYDCTTTANIASDAGISDVEPLMFRGINKPNNDANMDAVMDAMLTKKPAAVLLFGVPVTTNLYVALQKAQGLLLTCTPGAYTEACMPSLSKEQVSTLMSGQVKKWTEIKNAAGLDLVAVANDATATATYPANVTTFVELDGGAAKNIAPTDAKFHYCKRIEGSGTGAVQYATFLNAPCSDTAMEGDNFATSAVNGPVKHELRGSVDMEKCLSDFANKTNTGIQWTSGTSITTPINTALASGWAIGQQSLENNAGGIPAKHYRFVKIDGVAPTLANAFSGKYYDWAEATYLWRTGANAPTGDKLPIIEKIATDAASAYIIARVLNPNFIHVFGQSGYLASGKTNVFGAALSLDYPVMPYTHAPDNFATSACRIPVLQKSATIKPL